MKEKENVAGMDPAQDRNLFKSELENWNSQFAAQKTASWDRIPDIELYMDQVVTFLDRQFVIQRENEEERIITPSMINNYTKDNVIPRAESKKYSRDHIALLMVVCSLKKVLSMPDLSNLLKDFKANESDQVEKFYERFRAVQEIAMTRTSGIIAAEMEKIDGENEKETLRNLALQLAVEAQTKCIAAERILGVLEKNMDVREKPEKAK